MSRLDIELIFEPDSPSTSDSQINVPIKAEDSHRVSSKMEDIDSYRCNLQKDIKVQNIAISVVI